MTIIVDSPFSGRGLSGGNNAGSFTALCVHDEEDFSNHANGIIAVFLVAMRGIIPFDAVDIVENPNGVTKINAMLF